MAEKSNIKKEFLRFLDENNALNKFEKNIAKNSRYDSTDDILEYVESGSLYMASILDYAFTWSGTPEGREFWKDLNNEWKNIIAEKIINNDRGHVVEAPRLRKSKQ